MPLESSSYDILKDIDRIKSLLSYGEVDSPLEEDFDSLTALVSVICDAPVALISFIDSEYQWVKSKIGLTESGFPAQEGLCQYTIKQDDLIEIENTLESEMVNHLSIVKMKDGFRFYAGVPLKAPDGHKIGTLCILDYKPKKLSGEQKKALTLVANHIVALLEIKKKNTALGSELNNIVKSKTEEISSKLSQKEADYNIVFNTISKSSLVAEYSPDGFITTINPNFEQTIGYQEEELKGKHHSVLLDKNDYEKDEHLWETIRDGAYRAEQMRVMTKDKVEVWIQSFFSPIKDLEGNVVRIIQVARNISTEILATRALEEAKNMAEEINIQKDYFIANMSHEIRTPINAILGFTDLLFQMEDDDKKKHYLQSVKMAGDKLLYIVNDILDLSKIEQGEFDIDLAPFNLKETVKSVFSILHVTAEEKNIDLNYTIHSEINDEILGDKNRLSQILINLLGNSLKFTEKGRITLSVELTKDKADNTLLAFEVSDTGIGIESKKLGKIFERFSQAEETTARKYGGTGLGLNISKLLVEKMGGTITVESEVNKGSTFTFTIPFIKVAKEKAETTSKSVAQEIETKKARILLCEDNLLNQELVAAIFSTTNYEMEIAQNGNRAIRLLKDKAFDLILMDIQMPEKDGYQATKEIREELELSIPIIGLSAHSMNTEIEKCRKVGMNDYISKPFSRHELLKKIDSWLEEAPTKKQKSFSLDKLEEMTGNNLDLQKKLIGLFIEESIESADNIKSALKNSDWNELNGIIHKLKSSFGLLQANVNLLSEIERVLPVNPTQQELKDSTDSLISYIENLVSDLKKLLEELK